MRRARWDASRQVQEHCGGMLVRGNRLAKRHIPQVLQCVGHRVISRVARFPQAVALRKLSRSKRGQPQQVVRAVLDHIYSQVVASVNLKLRPVRIA